VGVSKRIGNERERARLKEVVQSLKPPGTGVVVRTMAANLTKKDLKGDIGYLVNTWEKVKQKIASGRKPPFLVHEEPDIVIRAARDMFTEEVDELVVDDERDYQRVREFMESFLPERVNDVRLYQGSEPLFDEFGVEDEIARALSRKVPLPSGGYLIIDQAEALTA